LEEATNFKCSFGHNARSALNDEVFLGHSDLVSINNRCPWTFDEHVLMVRRRSVKLGHCNNTSEQVDVPFVFHHDLGRVEEDSKIEIGN
jgi:hypothetical protein